MSENLNIEEGPFDDAPILLQLRDLVAELLTECTDAKETGNSGCGMGTADVELDLNGVKFTVSISLSEDDEVEH